MGYIANVPIIGMKDSMKYGILSRALERYLRGSGSSSLLVVVLNVWF